MDHIESDKTPRRSIGKLRKCEKTKPRSPDLVGEIRFQRHLLETLNKQFEETGSDEIVCCLAAWANHDSIGPYLTIEISPKYVRREYRPERSNLSFIFSDDEEAQ